MSDESLALYEIAKAINRLADEKSRAQSYREKMDKRPPPDFMSPVNDLLERAGMIKPKPKIIRPEIRPEV